MSENICRLIADETDPLAGNNRFHVEDIADSSTSSILDEILKSDKAYGFWSKPVIKYGIKNNRAHLSDSQVRKAVNWSLTAFDFLIENELKFVTDVSEADFSYEFRATSEDPDLTANTLAYAGYPNAPEKYRKIIVINTDFIWSPTGKPIKGSDLISMGYQVQFPDSLYITWDLDQVLRHENGHKLGLPHSPNEDKLMSKNYTIMNEWIDDETRERILAKYSERSLTEEQRNRLKILSKKRTENY